MPADRRLPLIDALVAVAAELALAALALFAADGLAHWRLGVAGFFACWAAWPAGLLAARALGAWPAVPGWLIRTVEVALPGLVLNEINDRGGHGLGLAPMAYVVALVAVLVQGWRFWLRAAAARGHRTGAEALRLLLAGGAGVWVALPWFTERLVGGVDARWYAAMLGDWVAQERAGVFPVFLGQGALAFNGAVHPFRSAPCYQYLGGLWDLLTLHTLTPVSLQHLTAITAALGGALGLYLALTALAPARRWAAAAVAVVYVTSPAVLAPLYLADQYMTFLTLAALPPVLYGNLALFRSGRGWPWAAAGLVLVWLCHPPVAILATLATAVFQGGRLVWGGATAGDGWRAIGGATLFAVLGAFYFTSMAEVPSPLQPSVTLMVLQLAGAGAGLAGLGWVLRRPAGWGWLPLLGGAFLLGRTRPAWLLALALAVAGGWLLAAVARRRWQAAPADRWIVPAAALVLAAVLTPLLWRGGWPPENADKVALLALNAASWRDLFRPVTVLHNSAADFRPGWGMWLLLVLLAGSALRGRSRRSALVLAVALGLLFAALPLPGFSAFWIAFLPRALVEMVDFPLVNRLLPPLAAVACAGGFLALDDLGARRPGAGRLAGGLLFALAAWQAAQVWPFLRHGWAVTHTRSDTEELFRPENALLDRVAYDLVPIPYYVSNGKVDPRLESRLWIRNPTVRVGPDEIARRMEAVDGREIRLTSAVDPTAPAWLNLAPDLPLAPGEHVLLRFEFFDRDYRGYLVLKSAHTYRDYQLPDSGWPLAFGVGRGRSKVLSLWNSGATEEVVHLSFQRADPAAAGREFGDFARVHVSHYRPGLTPVRLESLIPYRVTVDMPTAGWLETPRVYVPGYAATVDGHPAPVSESSRVLVRVPLPSGRHEVEVRFAGTTAFWTAWWVSAAAWLALAGWAVRRARA